MHRIVKPLDYPVSADPATAFIDADGTAMVPKSRAEARGPGGW